MANLVNILALAIIGLVTAISDDDIISGRIANGDIAVENQFPYAISLQNISLLHEPTRGHRCGGALITLRHALTTASCLHEYINDTAVELNATEFRVFAGGRLLNNDSFPDTIRPVANFSIHPEFTGPPAFVNDIGIIFLVTQFPASTVTPLQLPSVSFNPPDFTRCQVAGWGGTDINTTASTELRFANKYVYNQGLCASIFNNQPKTLNIVPSMVCAASINIVASGCINDNGNALICNRTLTGILFMTDNCSSSSFPELYTRVVNYRNWIQSVTASSVLFTPSVSIIIGMYAFTQILFQNIVR